MGSKCDGASVGVLVLDDDGRVLIGTRADGAGLAPIAGHVFDEHDGYRSAAVAEVAEETGMTVVPGSLEYVAGGWRPNTCRRGDGPDGMGHEWQIFLASATGEPRSLDGAMGTLHWADRSELNALIRRTVMRAWERVDASEWAEQPGMEPVWCHWLVTMGMANAERVDLMAVENLLYAPPPVDDGTCDLCGAPYAELGSPGIDGFCSEACRDAAPEAQDSTLSAAHYEALQDALAGAQAAAAAWTRDVLRAAEVWTGIGPGDDRVLHDERYGRALGVANRLDELVQLADAVSDVADRTNAIHARRR